MKAIINWRRYDTETAGCVEKWNNGCGKGDFQRCEETLFVTRAGAWFVHGRGGPLSMYAKRAGFSNALEAGEAIIALTEFEAAAWMAERG